jgi:predicted Zn-dependent protease
MPAVAAAGGTYEPVAIGSDNERHLIDSSKDLERYFASQALLYNDAQSLALVRRVGHALRPQPLDDYIEYEFFVLRDPSPNAFALPNGHIYVHTGMLARLRDEAQLAGLLAHEINHVAGHHGIVEHRSTRNKQVAGMVLGSLSAWGGLLSLGLSTSVFGFSRELEQEADDRAALMLETSDYDPHALPEVFEILGHDYEGLNQRVATIWSTHPEIRARAETSRTKVAAMPHRERQSGDFESAVMTLRRITIEDYIQDDYAQTALALAESLVERHPQDAAVLHLLGDAWQGMGAQPRLDPAALSTAEKRDLRRDRARKTRAQRLAEQLQTEQGRAAYASNLTRAEETYRSVLVLDASYAAAHRGLGEVYEQLERPREAAESYLTYVRSAPDAADRPVVVARLRALTAKLKESGQ